jgi:hypothetical protein
VGGGKELARVLRSCANSAAGSQQQSTAHSHPAEVQYRLNTISPQAEGTSTQSGPLPTIATNYRLFLK